MTADRRRTTFAPLTAGRWESFVDLFGRERGASSGCWCMWWRITASKWNGMTREERRDGFYRCVASGIPTGVLAYEDDLAVGWCAVGPRETLPRLNRSRVAAPLDAVENVWAINCFYIRSGFRRSGMMEMLVEAAVDYARDNGAVAVEACPIEPERRLQWGEGFVGIASAFRDAGFSEVLRRSPKRPLMRRDIAR